MPWYIEMGPQGDVVTSTRIRLARNLKDYPFIVKMNREQAQEIVGKCSNALIEMPSAISKEMKLYKMEDMGIVDKQILVEKHLISPNMLAHGSGSAAIISSNESISVLINEEDHLRIQCLFAGMQLSEALELADKVDDLIEESLEYAFDENLGYLTCCPTNTGTGLRASVMLHLPALALSGQLSNMLMSITKLGMAVRGLYGEGSEGVGNFFQVSNQVTLGVSEAETIGKLKSIVNQVITNERNVRKSLEESNGPMLSDRVWRAFGILQNAQIMSSDEFMRLLSDLRLGISIGIIKNVTIEKLNELMVNIQPASILKIYGEGLSAIERDQMRAQLVRESLKQ